MLKITVTSHDAKALPQALTAQFGADGGTIGRAPESTLQLPDPDRVISRTHALITCRDGVYSLRDHGTVVPVFHNARPLGNRREVRLAAGDELAIGKYVLRVELAQAAPGVSAIDDRVADETLPLAASGGVPPGAAPDGAMLSWTGDAATGDVDAIRSVVIPSPVAPREPEGVADTGIAAARALRIPQAAPQAHPAGRSPVAEPTATGMHARAAATGDDALLRAFLDGAQLRDLDIPGGLTPERMREIGRMLHETVRGVLDLLAARALAKREVRADATVIVARDNNPLKFAPSVEAAITHLVMPRGEGFMPPVRAVADAYQSLHSHQLGFVAGMRAALGAILARLDPRVLQEVAYEESFADSLLPMSREARLWDAFTTLHAEVAREAEADFHALLGHEFLQAYRARVADVRDPGAGPSGS